MEDMVSVLLTISCVLVLTWIVKLVNWIWWKPMKPGRELKEQGFRGPPYRLLYGCMKENSRMTEEAWSKPMNLDHQILPRIDPYLDKIVKGYGKISMIWSGPTPRLIIVDPELAKQVLSSKFGHFEKPNQHPITKFIATGLANYQGEKWVKHRRLLSPAFHLEKLKVISFPSLRMLPALSTCCSELVNRWELLIGSKESYELDVWLELQKLTADVISRTAFGSSYIEGKQIVQLQSEQALLVGKALRTMYIPGFRYLPTKENIRMKKIQNEVQDLLWGIIKKKERAMKMGEPCNDDLLGLLLESNNEIRKEYKDNRLIIEEIIEECKLFYFAGQETTSVLLVWTMIVLSMHQSWRERAREEALQVFGRNAPDFDGLNRLKIVPVILHEVLRSYSGGIMIRQTSKTVKLGEFSPTGSPTPSPGAPNPT